MTACNSVVSQVSQAFEWYRVEETAVETADGYRILAMRLGGVWCYSTWGLEEKIIQKDGSLFFRNMEYKESYAIGEQVPPSYNYRLKTARYPIGCFHENNYGGTDAALVAAKLACELDFEQQQIKNGNGND